MDIIVYPALLILLVVWFDIKSEEDDAERGVIDRKDLKTGYYVALCNHGLLIPPAGQQKEVVWVYWEHSAGQYVVDAIDAGRRGLPAKHFVFLKQWDGEIEL